MSGRNRSASSEAMTIALCLSVCLLADPAALAQVPSELVEQALDQRISSLEIPAAPLSEALASLEEKTGLRFKVGDDVLAVMPYGGSTRIEISVRDMSVRSALRQVFAGLGLTMRVVGDRIVVEPIPAVAHLGQRLTLEEITLLDHLAREPWEAVAIDPPLDFQIDPQLDPQDAFKRALAQVRGDSALQKLDSATKALNWAWRPEGERIVLTTREDEIRRRLSLPLDLNYRGQALDTVLTELGNRAGVTVMYEPGALQAVDWREIRVDMTQKNVSAREALERICGRTGLRMEITPEGLRILGPFDPSNPGGVAPAATGSAESTTDLAIERRYIRVEVEVAPGVWVDAMVPLHELPVELRRECRRKVNQVIRGLVPTSSPDRAP